VIPFQQARAIRAVLGFIYHWQPSEIDDLDWDQMVSDYEDALEIHKAANSPKED
jgi:hypothetical protein